MKPESKYNGGNRRSLFENFDTSLISTTFHIARFGDAAVGGNYVVGAFVSSLQTATEALTNFALKAFEESANLEISRIAAGGTIENSFEGKLSFGQSIKLGDKVRARLVSMAADSLGETSDYTKVGSGVFDSIAAVVAKIGGTAEQMSERFNKTAPDLVKAVVLNSKVYGSGVPPSSIIRSFTKLYDTGRAPVREIFFMQNAGLRQAIARDEKKNGKLEKATLVDRAARVQSIFEKSISPEQLAMLENALQTKFGAAKSALVGIDDGAFGMNRKVGADPNGNPISVFSRLADLAKPFLDALTTGAKSLTEFSDPMLALANLIETYLQPIADELSANLARFMQQFAFAGGDIAAKLSEAFKQTFGYDFSKVDFATPITKFFDAIASFISGAGAEGLTGNKQLDSVIGALVDGVVKVLTAFVDRFILEFQKDPEKTFKIALLLNPSAVISFMILLASLVPLLFSFGRFLWSMGSVIMWATRGLLNFAPALISAGMNIGRLILALGFPIIGGVLLVIAGITFFSDELRRIGAWFSGQSSTFMQAVGAVFTALGSAGQNIKDAFSKLFKADLVGFAWHITSAIVELIKAAGIGIAAPFVGIGEMFKTYVIDPIVKLIPKMPAAGAAVRGSGAAALGSAGAVFGPAAKLLGFANGNPLGNMLVAYQKERASAPSSAQVVFANSSEAIIPGNKLSAFAANGGGGGNTISMTINNYSGDDIAATVRNVLEEILS